MRGKMYTWLLPVIILGIACVVILILMLIDAFRGNDKDKPKPDEVTVVGDPVDGNLEWVEYQDPTDGFTIKCVERNNVTIACGVKEDG